MKTKSLAITPLFLLLFAWPGFAAGPSHHAGLKNLDGTPESIGLSKEVLISLDVPLGSSHFDNTPVALIEGEPITFRELNKNLASVHASMSGESTSLKENYKALLNRIITTKLIVLEAMAIGLDELPGVKSQIDRYASDNLRKRLMATRLDGVEPDPVELDKLYKQMAREVRLITLYFPDETDALAFKKEFKSSGDFAVLANTFVEQGRASGDLNPQEYSKLKDLLPAIAEAAFALDVGDLSEIFTSNEGFLVFLVEDVRVYEDPQIEKEARQILLTPLLREKALEYGNELEEKHATVNEKLLKKVSFEPKKSGPFGLGKEVPVDEEALLKDERVVATVHGEEPFVITMGELAQAVEKKFFHGGKSAFRIGNELDTKKRVVLTNILFKECARVEANQQGLDKDKEYINEVEENTNALLFVSFANKMVAPSIKFNEQEMRDYYKKHIDEFSTPKMLRLKGLVFYKKSDAKKALEKLRKSADFKWVSSNSPGQVDKDSEDTYKLENQLLSLTALPESLHETVEDARQGETLLHTSDNGFHYVIIVEAVFPPRADAYENVRKPIGKAIYGEKFEASIVDWGAKLREGYDVWFFVREFEG